MTLDSVSPPESAQSIVDDLWAARESQVLIAAVELDVFTSISQGHDRAEAVAADLGAPVRGVRRLLDALVGIQYLDKRPDGGYQLDPLAARYLVRGLDGYLGDMVHEMKLLWPTWARLAEVIRTGEPVDRWDSEETARAMFPRLVEALFPMSLAPARAAAATLADAGPPIRDVLDVGAGSGVWSIAVAEEVPEARVTATDFPEVLSITRRFADQHGVGAQFDYLPGNLRATDFGECRYDLVTVGFVIQTEGERWGRRLVERVHRALRPGGRLLIAEIIPNDQRTGPTPAVVYGMDMVLYTDEGDVFTLAEYREWLMAAGFRTVQTINIPAPWPLVVATK